MEDLHIKLLSDFSHKLKLTDFRNAPHCTYVFSKYCQQFPDQYYQTNIRTDWYNTCITRMHLFSAKNIWRNWGMK